MNIRLLAAPVMVLVLFLCMLALDNTQFYSLHVWLSLFALSIALSLLFNARYADSECLTAVMVRYGIIIVMSISSVGVHIDQVAVVYVIIVALSAWIGSQLALLITAAYMGFGDFLADVSAKADYLPELVLITIGDADCIYMYMRSLREGEPIFKQRMLNTIKKDLEVWAKYCVIFETSRNPEFESEFLDKLGVQTTYADIATYAIKHKIIIPDDLIKIILTV